VAGQPGDDPTLLADGGQIFSMHALLQRVRTLRPDAWLVYRPHPHERLAGAALNAVLDLADVVDTHAELVSLIAMADEIHTISSPVGFSALLHGKAVFTWGTPFYAGWGLTHDAVDPLPWRARRITLDTLVAGTLLRYALYHDAQLHCFTTPEAIVQRMADTCARAPGAWQRVTRLARRLGSQWLQV
jgi:capsular polysaccharide export protein